MGGLGIGDIKPKNDAVLDKWGIWRFLPEENTVWRQIIKAIAKYYKAVADLLAQLVYLELILRHQGDSYALLPNWLSIVSKGGLAMVIILSFWTDLLLDCGVIASSFPRSYRLSSGPPVVL